jgi:hypothetical protein
VHIPPLSWAKEGTREGRGLRRMDEGRTEGVAVLRKLEVELTEASSLEMKL